MEKDTTRMILRECRFLLGDAEVTLARLGVYLEYMDDPKLIHLGKIAAGNIDTIRKATITQDKRLLKHMESVDILTEKGVQEDLRDSTKGERKEFSQVPTNRRE